MDQRISLVTLAVDDFESARRFFEAGLGWRASGASTDNVAFYQTGPMALALYPRHLLAEDAGVPLDGTGATLAVNMDSAAQVDAAFDEAVAAGAEPVKWPQTVFWGGYSSYVRIPGGPHLLEIAFNPFFPLDEEGGVRLP